MPSEAANLVNYKKVAIMLSIGRITLLLTKPIKLLNELRVSLAPRQSLLALLDGLHPVAQLDVRLHRLHGRHIGIGRTLQEHHREWRRHVPA